MLERHWNKVMSCETKTRPACDKARDCVWVPGMGCDNAAAPQSCSGRRRAQCEPPCQWITGKGCKGYGPSAEERSFWPTYAQQVWNERGALDPARRAEFLAAMGGPSHDDPAYAPSVRDAMAALNKTDLRFLDREEKRELARHVVAAGAFARLQPGREPLAERLKSSLQCERQVARSPCERLRHCEWSAEPEERCRERSLFRVHAEHVGRGDAAESDVGASLEEGGVEAPEPAPFDSNGGGPAERELLPNARSRSVKGPLSAEKKVGSEEPTSSGEDDERLEPGRSSEGDASSGAPAGPSGVREGRGELLRSQAPEADAPKAQGKLVRHEDMHRLLAAEASSAPFARGFHVDLHGAGRLVKHQVAARELGESRAHGRQMVALQRTEVSGQRRLGSKVPVKKNLLREILARFQDVEDLEPLVMISADKLLKPGETRLPSDASVYLEKLDLSAVELSVRALKRWMDEYRETYGLEESAFASSKVLQGDYDLAKRISSLLRIYERLANHKRTALALSRVEKKRRAALEFREALKAARASVCPTGVSKGVLCADDHYCQPLDGMYVTTKLAPGARPGDLSFVRGEARREVSEVSAELRDELASLFLTYSAVAELTWEVAQNASVGFRDLLATLAGPRLGWGFSNKRVELPKELKHLDVPPELERLRKKHAQEYYSTDLPSLTEALGLLQRTAESARVREAPVGKTLLTRAVEFVTGLLRLFQLLRHRGLGLGQVCPDFRVAEAVTEARDALRKAAPDMLRRAPLDVRYLVCYDDSSCRPRITSGDALDIGAGLTCAVDLKPWLDLRNSPDIALLAPAVVQGYVEQNFRPKVVFERLRGPPMGPSRGGDAVFEELLQVIASQTDCNQRMCAVPSIEGLVSIASKEAWRKHLLANHPDKVSSQRKSKAHEVSKILNALKEECVKHGIYCRDFDGANDKMRRRDLGKSVAELRSE